MSLTQSFSLKKNFFLGGGLFRVYGKLSHSKPFYPNVGKEGYYALQNKNLTIFFTKKIKNEVVSKKW